MADPFAPQNPPRNYLDDLIEQAQQDLELERQRQEAIITAEEPDKVLGSINKVEKQIENESPEVQRSVLDKTYSPGYFDRGVRGGNISRPMQEYSPVKNQQEKKQPISESMYNALAGGSAKLGADLASSAGFIYGLASTPQRLIAKIPGLEFMDDGTREMEEYLTLNPVAKYYKEQADYHREQNTRYDQSITEYLQEGNFMDAIGLTAVSIVESIPYTASIMAGGAYGIPAKTMIPLITASTGGGKSAELMENLPEMSDNKRILNALTDGLAEGAWEQIGTAGIGRTLKQVRSSLTRSLGREKGEKVLKDATAKVVEDKLSRYIVSKSALKEGATEFATTVTQNLNAMVSGEDPNRELFEGAIDAFIVGAGSGGLLSAPTSIQVRSQRKQLEEQQQEADKLQSRVDAIETEQDVRRLASEMNIKQQQKEGTDFVGKLISKAESESGVTIEREYLDRTLADEIQDEELSDERVKEILTEHGISEDVNPEDLMVVGRTSGGVIRISTAGTTDRMADEFVAVNEEMSEVFYNAEVENRGEEFENEITEERKNYHEATGEADTGESNQEWFSSMAVRFATQGKVHQSIGARLRDVFDRFVAQAKLILRDSFRLRKAIREGKVPESLIQKLEQATDFKTVGKKVKQAKKVQQVAKAEGRKATPDGGVSYRISEVGKVDPVGVFVIGADMVARDLDGKLNPFGLRYTENFQGFQLSKAGATKLVKNGKEGFNTVAVIAYDDIKGSQVANPSFQNRVKEKLTKVIGKRRLNKLLKENDNNVQVISGIVNKEIQEANKNKAKKDKKEKINLTQIALDNAEPDSPQLRRKIIYVGTLKEIRTGKDRFEKHDVYPAEQIFDTLVELKEPIPIDDLIADLPDTDMRKKNWGMMVTQTNFMMTADESNVSKQLMEMAEIGKDVFTGTSNPDYQFYSSETDQTLTAEEAISKSGDEKEFKSRQFVSQVDEELGLGTATRGSVGLTEEYGNEPSLVTRFFGKQDPKLLEYRGALIGLMFDQINVTNFIGDENAESSLIKITIDKTDLSDLNLVLTARNIPSKTVRIRGNEQDIFIWNFNDIDVDYVLALAEHYNAKEQTEQRGRFENLTTTEVRSEARQRYIEIIQDYQSKTNASIPKAFTKFLPDFFSRKADRDKLQKQLKAKPKATYRLTPTFYSQAERVVTDKFPPTMKSQSVENFLKKNQVKPEEIEWLDLESLLKGKLKITKEELQEWIQANKIDVQDVTFGQYKEDPKAKKQLIKLYEKRSQELGWFVNQTTKIKIKGYEDKIVDRFKLNQVVITGEGASTKITENLYDGKINPIGYFNNKNYEVYGGVQNSLEYTHRLNSLYNLEKEINELESKEAKMREKKDTEYESYQLPGEKEDYRELLLTLPSKNLYNIIDEYGTVKQRNLPDEESLAIAMGSDDLARVPVGREKDTFNTSHFKQSNILAHVRFNTRISPTGERILFIEELQSDWHKEGREKGYKENLTELPEGYTVKKWEVSRDEKMFEKANFSDRVNDNFSKTKNRYQVKNPSGGSAGGVFTTEESAIKNALGNLNANKVPNAPFKGNGWIELIMKRMLRHASDNNFDRIAWTTSNQQIDRWRSDLRQNVDQIQWQKITKSSLEAEIRSRMAKTGRTGDISTLMEGVIDQNKNTVIINGLKNKENKFNQTIPLEGETTINGQRVTLEGLLGKQMATQIRNSNKRTGIIEGDDLTIGGQGFKVVYDFAISKILNKMGKKFGAKVDQVTLRTNEVEGLDAIIGGFAGNAQPSIRITNLMKDSVQKGQPTFRITEMAEKNVVTPLAKVYQEQKGDKKSYTKKDFEQDLAKLGYSEDMIKTAKDLFGIIRIKQIETTEPTPIEKELKKLQERQITQSEIKNRIKRAYRLGANEKEKEITKLQKIITKYARENLPKGLYQKSEVTGLLAKLRDAKRFRELRTAMERIDRVIDNVSKRSALAKFNKTIKKKATVKKVGGIGRGKVGAEVQDIVDKIREVHKMSPVEVEERLEVITKVIDANNDGEPTDQQSVDINILMQYGGIKNKTPQQIAEATGSLDDLITKGRMQIMDEQQAYGERMSVVRQKILDVITGGEGGQTQAGGQKLGLKDEGFFKDLRKKLGDFDNDQQSLEYIFDKLSRFDKDSKPLQSFINEYFMPMIRQARVAEYNGIVEMQKTLQENASRIFGVKGKKLVKLLNENTVNTVTIDHYDGVSKEGIKGDLVTSTLTYNQAYKKWMELKDPTLSGTFEKMGWDVPKAITQIEKQLPDKVLEWAEWQLYEFYPMYYARVNETFRKRFYVNMPMNAMYSPISRRVGARADEGDDTLNKSKSPMGSVSSAGSLKGRVSNKEELAWIDGDTTLMKHITEMEHFIHYTDVMRELRSVFMSREISRSIRDFHGDKISRVLNKFMDDIARGGVDRAQQIDWMDWMRANFSRSVIGANPVVFLKQLSSIPAYIADIPASFWTKEFLKLTNPIEFRKMTKIISKSEVLKMRYDKGFDRDMMLALQNIKPGKAITGANFFNNAMYALTKLGDKQAIYLGGYPVYKYYLKQALKAGKSRKEAEQFAMKKFEQATLRSQQAGDVEDLADFQRRGSIAKLFTMFMTSPNQYYRMVAGGYRNLYYGRGSKLENWRKIFVGQILLPSLFTFIGNGFDFETDEQIMSLFLFPFSGLLFWGQGFEFAIRSAYRKAYPMGTVAILDPFAHAGKGLSKLADDKTMDSEKVLMIADQFIEGASKVAGVPYGAVKRTAKGVMKVAKGESEAPIRQIIGFNMPTKKKPKKSKKKKKRKILF